MKKVFTISQNYNSFLWLPPKTASSTLSWILGHYDFAHYIEHEGSLKLVRNDIIHFGHETNFPPNYNSMSFIVSTANPYDRVFSLFKMVNAEREDKITVEEFEKFIDNHVFRNTNLTWNISSKFNGRNPDYVIRKERLYEDLSLIPFIKYSKIYDCGIIEDMCKKRVNSSFDVEYKEIFLNQKIKEKIYIFFESDFNFFGYSK